MKFSKPKLYNLPNPLLSTIKSMVEMEVLYKQTEEGLLHRIHFLSHGVPLARVEYSGTLYINPNVINKIKEKHKYNTITEIQETLSIEFFNQHDYFINTIIYDTPI